MGWRWPGSPVPAGEKKKGLKAAKKRAIRKGWSWLLTLVIAPPRDANAGRWVRRNGQLLAVRTVALGDAKEAQAVPRGVFSALRTPATSEGQGTPAHGDAFPVSARAGRDKTECDHRWCGAQ